MHFFQPFLMIFSASTILMATAGLTAVPLSYLCTLLQMWSHSQQIEKINHLGVTLTCCCRTIGCSSLSQKVQMDMGSENRFWLWRLTQKICQISQPSPYHPLVSNFCSLSFFPVLILLKKKKSILFHLPNFLGCSCSLSKVWFIYFF